MYTLSDEDVPVCMNCDALDTASGIRGSFNFYESIVLSGCFSEAESYFPNMAPVLSKLTSNPPALAVSAAAVLLLLLWIRRRGAAPAPSSSGKERRSRSGSGTEKDRSKDRKPAVQVDGVFLRRLSSILKVCFPRVMGVEGLLMLMLTVLLILRTRLTVVMANVVSMNAKHLVQREFLPFVSGVIDIGLWSLPSSVVNSGIRYMSTLLEQRFRKNLVEELHHRYLATGAVYKLTTKYRHTIDNPDHRLTQDTAAFCAEIADIFPTTFKPTIDILTFVYQLSKNGGFFPPAVMIAYYIGAGAVLRALMPNFAKLTAMTQHKEGDFRWAHAQIIQHAEEVAFYRGESIERENVDKLLESVIKHYLNVGWLKSFTDFADAVLIKYGATCCGYAVCSIGVFAAKTNDSAERTRIYIRSSQLYIPLARAIGKIIMLHKKITALAGYTSRVAEIREVFKVIEADRSHTVITISPRCDVIDVQGIDVVSPNNSTLISNLSLTVRRQQHLLIMGTNGSGKSALMRVLTGMWPCASGTITRPTAGELYFLPQRTYLPNGDLRFQLLYPDSTEDARRKGITDEEIMKMVEDVGLTAVVEREGGLDSVKEWNDVLSGGERQRVALVRLLYRRPVFGFLDECTSAVSQDIEPQLYVAAKQRGITLVTVSHREALKRFHNQLLELDGKGGYKLSTIA